MDWELTEDQRLLVDGVREVLDRECSAEAVRAAWQAGAFDPARWKLLAELGVAGLTVAPEAGGMGLDERDLVTLLIETGRVALPEPVVEVTAVAAPLLAVVGGEVAATWLPRIAAGEAIVVPVLAVDPYPAHAGAADLLLVQAGSELHAVSPDEAALTPQRNVDGARPTVSVAAHLGATTMVAGDVAAALALAAARGATAAAAQLVGLGRAMIDQSVAYAQQREQFGRPIGSFQAVKHHLASALVEVEFARPLVERAAFTLAVGGSAGPRHAALAKAAAGDAARTAAKVAIQVHGAIGYTEECDLHLWMRRAWSLDAAWGDATSCWRNVEADLFT